MDNYIKITNDGIIPVREPLKLVKSNDPVLTSVIPEFDFKKHNAVDIANQLVAALQVNGGYGLAAPQVGLKHRVFVMGMDEQIVAFFNPKILEMSEETSKMEEGCLSFPYLFLKIDRPKTIKVSYQDYAGKHHNATYVGMTARIFQHEFDHLNGVLFTDRAGPTTLIMAKQKQAKYFKKAQRVGK